MKECLPYLLPDAETLSEDTEDEGGGEGCLEKWDASDSMMNEEQDVDARVRTSKPSARS